MGSRMSSSRTGPCPNPLPRLESSAHQLREDITRAWDTVTEGWRELVERAGDALTRFHPKHSGDALETHEERIAQRGARCWRPR